MSLARDINRLLKQRGSPMAGLGAAFVKAGRKWGVDPRLLVSIAGHESEWGTKGYAVGTNNPFGWGVSEGIKFPTWEDSIYTVARGLRKGYLDEGLRSIDRISGKYAPVGAANDPTNLNSSWTAGVSAVYRQLGGEGEVGPGPAPFVSGRQRANGTRGSRAGALDALLSIAQGGSAVDALTEMAAAKRTAAVTPAASGTGAGAGRGRGRAGKAQPGLVLGEGWSMGGGPDAHGSRPLGNWQSDRAWDLMAPAGTPVYAPTDSVIVKSRFADNGKTVWGWQVTLAGGGDTFFLTHLGELAKGVKAGGKVKRGQLIGWLGQPPYFASHLHIGIERGDLADYMQGV